MPELEDYGINQATLQRMYDEWGRWHTEERAGAPVHRESAEPRQTVSGLVRRELGIETERRHALVAESRRLRELLKRHGVDPEDAENAND